MARPTSIATAAIGLALPALAAGSDSTNYSNTPATVAGGGTVLTAPGAPISSTVTVSPTTSGGSSANASNLSGYQGQLFDPLAVLASATPDSVPETGTSQIAASVLLDDGSRLVPPLTDYSLSIVSGPVAAVSPLGLITTSPVAEDASAVVRVALFGLAADVSVLVTNTDPDNLGLYAGDGLDDAWQLEFFGPDNPRALPRVDADLDGLDNEFENAARLDPTDPDSRFTFDLDFDPDNPAHRIVHFSPRWEGVTYELWYTPSLDLPFVRIDSAPLTATTDGGPAFLTDPAAGRLGFYKVFVRNGPPAP